MMIIIMIMIWSIKADDQRMIKTDMVYGEKKSSKDKKDNS